MSARLVVAGASYALVVVVGVVGILLASGPGEGLPLVSTWLGFAGLGGVGGAVLVASKQAAGSASSAAEAVADVKADTSALRNGELEGKIKRVVGAELARHAEDVEQRIERKLSTTAVDIADLVAARMAS